MKIIYFAHSVLNRGGDKMVLAHLGHLASSGHHVHIKISKIDTIFSIHPSITMEVLPFRSKVGTLFTALTGKQDADCVIASIVPTAVSLFFRNKGRVLLFAQDDNLTANDSMLYRYLIHFLYLVAFSIFAIPTIAVSPKLAEIFKERYNANCIVVHNGVDTNLFFPAPSHKFKPVKDARKTVLVLARKEKRKGFDIARQVFAELSTSTHIPFEIWTVGEELPLDLSQPVRHFGNLREGSLRDIMSNADVFFYPSLSEGFGLMVLEAFACQCPVVTSDAISFVTDNENALVAKVGDIPAMSLNIIRLWEDSELANKITAAGYQFAQNNQLLKCCECFEKEITKLVARS